MIFDPSSDPSPTFECEFTRKRMVCLMSKGWEYLKTVRNSRGDMAPKNGRRSVLNKTLGRVIEDSGFSDSRVNKLLSSL